MRKDLILDLKERIGSTFIMGLDLYAKVEPYLDFEEEVYTLHKEFCRFVMVNELDNIIDIDVVKDIFRI